MGYLPSSLRRKAVNLVSDLTTVIFNPISDRSSDPTEEPGTSSDKSDSEKDFEPPEGPDTSSFTAFLVSLLSSTDSSGHVAEESKEQQEGMGETETASESVMKEHSVKKGLLSRGKQSVGKAIQRIAFIGGYRQISEAKADEAATNDSELVVQELKIFSDDRRSRFKLPVISEPSSLMSEDMRRFLYFSLPAVAQGRNWLLLYSTWRHGISLSTLYRRSLLCPGYCLLVVGDQKGAVFGGLAEAPFRPSNKKYQGTNSSFVFTNIYDSPIIFRPTGANHYFTLCSPDYFAMGGGGHFALYLDVDLLNGSSYQSETFGNPCLAHSEDFKVKEVELWGFVYPSKYEEMLTLSRTEKPGIWSW
ncbi:oxidation resistance protein 1 [Phalaenopsis equestris]|uniref:oxidation resistance protein 1 n=1 Tax=Phalaenopsis equestris TaxID=78828 RepID=UPI0009E249BD|nr:oxidation resistance protein 1 [Phalaenopsis equestris]